MKAAGQALTLASIRWLYCLGSDPATITTNFGHADGIGNAIDETILRNTMHTELTEEEIRRALFGGSESSVPAINLHAQDTVPDALTEQALALLDTIKPYSGHREFVFPADRDPRTHCNSQTASMALKRMGFEGRLVSHGMRSMASTILNEQGWDPELIEVALAHVDKDEVRSAYNRADYVERRRPMMIWWGEHIQQAATGSLSVSALHTTRSLNIVSMR